MLQFSDYLKKINNNRSTKNETVLYGAGLVGSIALEVFAEKEIRIEYICDRDKKIKEKKRINNIKIISPSQLDNLNRDTDIIVSARYFRSIIPFLKNKGFNNLFKLTDLMSGLNFAKYYKGNLPLIKVQRLANYYVMMGMEEEYLRNGKLNLKSVDIQVTEKCSLKCKDCCNLMQYYERPKDVETDVLIKSVDKLMTCIDNLDEFRVLGGDPFMNKNFHKTINKLKDYENCKKIVVYTNAKFVPKGENLNCLKHKKIILEITNYGESSSANDRFVEIAKKENIAYQSVRVTTWQDSGRILPRSNKNGKELNKLFDDCCQSDLISLLHGKLYRCPFSANAANLKAIPQNDSDEVNLLDKNLTKVELRQKIKALTYDKKFLTACSYCMGRDFTTALIPSAIQTKKPLEYEKVQNF